MITKSNLHLGGALFFAVLTCSACGQNGSSANAAPAPAAANPAAGKTLSLAIQNFAFMQMDASIAVGTTVTWKNLDEEPHTVASVDGLFHSPALDEGGTFSFKFDKPGVYKYFCSIHPKMTGTITVK